MRTSQSTRGGILLLAVAALACGDATAPSDRTLQVIVADTLRPGDIPVTVRNSTGSVVHLDWCNETLEQASSTGAWPDPVPRQNACLAYDLAPGDEEKQTRVVMVPGRYRYVFPYYLGGSTDYARAYSNQFVVLP